MQCRESLQVSNLYALRQKVDEWISHTIKRSTGETLDIVKWLKQVLLTAQLQNVENTLQHIPNIGEFLTLLMKEDVIRVDPDVLHNLIQCFLRLYSTHIGTDVKEWMMVTIKNAVTLPSQLSNTVCKLGIDRQRIAHRYVKQISKTIAEHLKTVNNVRCCCDHQSDNKTMKFLTTLLECCPFSDEFSLVWVEIIRTASFFQQKDKFLFTILQKLKENVTNFENKEESGFPDCVQEELYLYYREALERDFLNLVDECCDFSLPSTIKHRLKKSTLVMICTRNNQILAACIEMLNMLLIQTHGCGSITKVIHSFFLTVHPAAGHSKTSESKRTFLYEEFLHPMVKMLDVSWQDMDLKTAGEQIKTLSQQLQNFEGCISNHQKNLVLFCLHHHMFVYYRILEYCLMCDKTYIAYCLDVLLAYHFKPEENKLKDIKGRLHIVLTCLRALLTKNTLRIADIKCAIMSLQTEDCLSKNIMVQILWCFLFKSNGGFKIGPAILQLGTGSDLPLQTILQAHEYLNIQPHLWSSEKIQEHRHLINALMEKYNGDENWPEVLSAAKTLLNAS